MLTYKFASFLVDDKLAGDILGEFYSSLIYKQALHDKFYSSPGKMETPITIFSKLASDECLC